MSLPTTMTIPQQLGSIATELRLIAERNRRTNLAQRLDAVAPALAHTSLQVVIVGQFKQGKSALVNALVSAQVCPVDDVIATSVPTVVRWGETPSAALITEIAGEPEIFRTDVDPLKLRQHVTELAGEAGFLGNLHAEVRLPRQILSDGIMFVDTPGVGRAQARASTNVTILPQVDAAIMVTDATQELTDPELTFLKQAVALCPRVACVISKVDLQHQWRGIIEANADHLAHAGIKVPIIATSALLHDLALEDSDRTLRRESNIDFLTTYLRDVVREDVLATRRRSAADDICSVGEHLAMVFEAELESHRSPENESTIVHNLEQAEKTAGLLVQRSARWQQTLSDGAGDLVSDIEFDLRDRLRAVGREAEQLIDTSDPGKNWEDIGVWLAESVTQVVSDNFVWAHQRSTHLAEVVAQHFSLDGRAAVPQLTLSRTDHALKAVGELDFVRSGKLSVGQKLMIGMKGSYGGVLMFGLMTTLAGMALVNPISVAAGLIMGGFAYRQDAQNRLDQRRTEAKNAVRKLIDEANFQIGKESRDRIGRIKRILRDHFVAVAEDMSHSLNESVRIAKQSGSLPPTEREQRARVIVAELSKIRQLCQQAETLTKQEPDLSGQRISA